MAATILTAPGAFAADDDSSQYANSGSSSIMAEASTTFSIEDEKSIGIALSSDAIVLTISPTSSGAFNSKSFTVDVSTNNPTGYTLTMTADKTALSRTSAINGSTPTIPTIPTDKTFTETNFETGYWGYKLGTSTNYLPMTTSTIPVNTTEAAANSSINTITFASKLDNSIPSGTYSGITISFIATTNAVSKTIGDITYLQDFATLSESDMTSVLNSMTTGETYSKKDSRDDQTYTISKLADERVWLTKNLNLPTGTGLYSDDSNVPSGYPKSGGTPYYTISTSSLNYTNETCGEQPCYSYYTNTDRTAGEGGASSTHDICPSGWELPSTGEYKALVLAYGAGGNGDLLTQSPINMVYSGYYDYGDKFTSTWNTYYWTSTEGNINSDEDFTASAVFNIQKVGTGATWFGFRPSYTGVITITNGDYARGAIAARCILSE